ncbi:isochorismatase hydrolase [Ketogulonicigenium vulgare Y25]|nr:isochorismatase hydrolase [Ketogulonicigenium vulgare Y25]AOZ54965.1 Isochorismatase family protein [Ketogulonicigenium vulgare]
MYEGIRQNPPRKPFGLGERVALVNIDLQRAYTDVGSFKTAYTGHPQQMDHINTLTDVCRQLGAPVIWTYVAYLPHSEDAGLWGTRTDTPDSLQNIKDGSPRAELDPRLNIADSDIKLRKHMASVFTETLLPSLFTFKKVDTVILTGGSTSGCVRASAVEALSRSYRAIVVEECVADKHESPHFASLYDICAKYGDVMGIDAVLTELRGRL